MHEAGIAVAIAEEILDRRLNPADLRIHVSGGHGGIASFDAALRSQLEAAAPGRGFGRIVIVHEPTQRLCARCATTFKAASHDESCPGCGGPSLVVPEPELVELEWDEPARALDGPDGAPNRDPRPFVSNAFHRETGAMDHHEHPGRT